MGQVDSLNSTGNALNALSSSNEALSNTVNHFIKKGNYAERTISLPEGGSYKMTVSFNGMTNELDRDKFLNNIDKATIDAIVNIAINMGLGKERKTSDGKRANVQAVNFSLNENKKFSATKFFENNLSNKKIVNSEYYTAKATTPSNNDQTIIAKNENRLRKASMFNDLDDLFSRSFIKNSSQQLADTEPKKGQINEKDASEEEPSDELQKNSAAKKRRIDKFINKKINSVAAKYENSKANSQDRTPIVAYNFWEEYPRGNPAKTGSNLNDERNYLLDENGGIAQNNIKEQIITLTKNNPSSLDLFFPKPTVLPAENNFEEDKVDIAKKTEREQKIRAIVDNNFFAVPKITAKSETKSPIKKIEQKNLGVFPNRIRFNGIKKDVAKNSKPKNMQPKIENTPTKDSTNPKLTGQTEQEAWNNFANTTW